MTNLIPTNDAHRIALRLGVVRLIATALEVTTDLDRDRTADAEQILTEYDRLTTTTTRPDPMPLRIDGTWLVEDVGTHTCGAGDVYGHEPGCGSIPVTNLATLDGFDQLGQYLDGDPTADHQCRSTHHAGGAGLRRCTWWHNHPNSRRHSDGSYVWTDETRNPAPTEEAAALRSAPLANVRRQDLDHNPGNPCSMCAPDAGHNAR